ncbi:UNVERIFIED_CONTAM: hypothetical protein GTU68_036264 [Idotea baltica]|nr:hypothetical protein [Idotea baltica]
MVKLLASIFVSEVRLLCRRPINIMNPLVFFMIVLVLFPLAIGPETKILQIISPGVIWVVALLAVLLSLDGLFRGDFEDGSLEQWILSSNSLPLLVIIKVVVHWIFSGMVLVCVAPFFAIMLGLPLRCIPVLLMTLILGTPILSFLGAIGSSLTVGLKQGSLLLALLILPLYIPVLILGSGALQASFQGLPASGQLFWLASLAVLTITLSPFAIAAGLKISIAE